MGVEIERKFLLRDERWKTLGQGVLIRQGYLSSHGDRIVRVRIVGQEAILTIKGRSQGAARDEWEYSIPLADAEVFLDTLCEKPIIEKYRYRVPHDGMTWEIDEFLGDNAGLVVAEIELEAEDQLFSKPDWIGEDVTHDSRYVNANLLRHPYSKW
ncbi:MAG TPA: CYTH domain-containing protein [Noviherbaspirillum sp.]|jgi:adenylate cyclase|uniref:CYTH domain-containing protein n=1 Tax=Noviherbaspirillum sp. TaxID=1926288 RepID=UPI002DDD1417|nr:CYTH domain-containing protein [Noviherbaspirillum sp.]HEV2609799.1 CYTH domain-containing protein [Noviherbaspirillum sp.]